MHLTEEQLNEYLDEASTERVQIEAHLDSCDECAARLSTLQKLFAELNSLPELELTRDLAARFAPRPSQPAQLPKFLTLTVTLQAAFALTAIILAAPFVIQLLPAFELSTFSDVFIQLQTQWTASLDILSQFQMPALPAIPFELSSLYLMSALVVASMLWLVGNGLLLRNQIK
jgi:anti-sigma factor RsiW